MEGVFKEKPNRNLSSLNPYVEFSLHQKILAKPTTLIMDQGMKNLLFYYVIMKIIMFKDLGYNGLCII